MKRALWLVALVACKGKPAPAEVHDGGVTRDASAGDATAADFAELARFPHVEPVHVVALPVKPSNPRFDVGGPAIAGEVAAVASSQFGFVGVDYHRGQIIWTKPAGLHVAPPLARGNGFLLVGECLSAVNVADGRQLLGCARLVTQLGADQSYVAIYGRQKDVNAFAIEPGMQRLYAIDDHTVLWRRGDRAVVFDPITGSATPTPPIDPPLVVHYKDKSWDIRRNDDGLITAMQKNKVAWHTDHPYTEVLGAVYLPGQAPMVRVSNVGRYGGHPEMNLLDIDATGSMHGQVAFPVPGIGLVGHAIDSIGDVALAIQLDTSLDHHFVVGYAANALLMWVYVLPRMQRADPVGVAVAPDAVVVFHDGDTLAILPELSAPPTAPGAARAPLENPTP